MALHRPLHPLQPLQELVPRPWHRHRRLCRLLHLRALFPAGRPPPRQRARQGTSLSELVERGELGLGMRRTELGIEDGQLRWNGCRCMDRTDRSRWWEKGWLWTNKRMGCDIPEEEPTVESLGACDMRVGGNSIVHFEAVVLLERQWHCESALEWTKT